MLATSVPTRHPAEARLLAQALAGDAAALDRVLTHLGSSNPYLQQIMSEAIADDGRPELLHWLLKGLAFGWGPALPPRRPLSPEQCARLEAALIQLFTQASPGMPVASGPPIQDEVLGAALVSPIAHLARLAATLLALRGDAAGFGHLVAAAAEGELPARLRAIRALGCLQDERAGPVLVEVLADFDHVDLHHAAAQALAELKEHALPALLAALRHPAQHVRWHACRLLGELGDARAAPALAEALDDESYTIRWAAAETLPSLGPAAIPAVLAQLARYAGQDDTYAAARYALHRLAFGPWRVRLEPLLAALDGPAASAHAPGLAQRLLAEHGDVA
jgi:HEAT repeat protein